MLKTHVVAILLVYFLALFDHTVNHDHIHVETVEITSCEGTSDKQRVS